MSGWSLCRHNASGYESTWCLIKTTVLTGINASKTEFVAILWNVLKQKEKWQRTENRITWWCFQKKTAETTAGNKKTFIEEKQQIVWWRCDRKNGLQLQQKCRRKQVIWMQGGNGNTNQPKRMLRNLGIQKVICHLP